LKTRGVLITALTVYHLIPVGAHAESQQTTRFHLLIKGGTAIPMLIAGGVAWGGGGTDFEQSRDAGPSLGAGLEVVLSPTVSLTTGYEYSKCPLDPRYVPWWYYSGPGTPPPSVSSEDATLKMATMAIKFRKVLPVFFPYLVIGTGLADATLPGITVDGPSSDETGPEERLRSVLFYLGVGVEYRARSRLGFFADARWLSTGEIGSLALLSAGVSLF